MGYYIILYQLKTNNEITNSLNKLTKENKMTKRTIINYELIINDRKISQYNNDNVKEIKKQIINNFGSLFLLSNDYELRKIRVIL